MKSKGLWAAIPLLLLLALLLLRPAWQAAVPAGDLPPLVTRPAIPRESRPGALDLNTATAEQLQALPSVGPVRARGIVDYRQQNGPFRSVEELAAVEGIGPGVLEQVRELVTVQEEIP